MVGAVPTAGLDVAVTLGTVAVTLGTVAVTLGTGEPSTSCTWRPNLCVDDVDVGGAVVVVVAYTFMRGNGNGEPSDTVRGVTGAETEVT